MIPRHLKIGVYILLMAVLILSVYLWRLKRHAASVPRAVEAAHVAPPQAGPQEQVTLYVAYDDPGMLMARAASVPLSEGRQQRADAVLRALLNAYLAEDSPHQLAAGSEIKNVYLVDPGLAVVDMSSVMANGHRSGILVEELTIVSVVQTLSTNVPGINRVKFLVDGKERETLAGHADLSSVYDTSNVAQLAERLKAGQ